MMVPSAAISPRLRLELRIFLDDRRSESLQHFFQYLILGNAQKPFAHLSLSMAIAQVESATKQVMRVRARNAVGSFPRGHDLHHASVITGEQIVVPQHCTSRREDGHFLSRGKRSAQAAVLTQLVR
jgi:hypothetical protein